MRITNTMMSNTMLMNISRNIRNLDNLLMQQATTKKIQVASDNPILASRALKFRTNVSETLQYQRNVTQGTSWMDITEVAFSQAVEIMKNIKDRCDQGANGPLEYTDRQKINTDINQLMEHLGTMMNQTYAGRYVFSGYRTDQEALFQKDNNKVYQIKQVFNVEDIENCRSYQKKDAITEPESHEVSILKLPYTGMAGIDDITIGTNTYTVVTRSTTVGDPDYDADAYDMTGENIVYIKETGELVLGANVAAGFKDGTEVSYVKDGFKQGEINPVVYFNCTDVTADYDPIFLSSNNKSYTITQTFNIPAAESDGTFIISLPYTDAKNISADLTGTIETMSKAEYDDLLLSPPIDFNDKMYYIEDTGDFIIGANLITVTAGTPSPATIDITYDKTGFAQGDTNPLFLIPSANNIITLKADNKSYNMDNQLLKYEFSVNTRIQINSLGKDVYTDKLYADLRDLVQLLNNVETSSEEKLMIEFKRLSGLVPGDTDYDANYANLTDEEIQTKIDDQLVSERQLIQDIIFNKFNNMLKQVDRHFSNMSKEQTDLASRMNRLDLIQGRLEQDEESYTKLLSENEDVDLLEISMLLYNAKAVYEASLKAGLNVIQMTLANYI